ncbi:MAG: hypothetical protein O210_OD1C00001G0551 [Parcubacteria bacterium RAAC4_OD1_1]|nr:MAG: hypothetical protein O210_OD1C00001G0551 [Parcubacteria bacterium RAAC4_OD1_1]
MKNLFKTFVFFIGGYPLMFPKISMNTVRSPRCMELIEEESKEKETEPESS